MIEEKVEYVTPGYLLSHGFLEYKKPEDVEIWKLPYLEEDAVGFYEENLDKNMFVVTFSKDIEDRTNDDGSSLYFHSIFVQQDAGCGFTCIPERWWQLPVEYFESIYYGIRGEKPKAVNTKYYAQRKNKLH